MRILKYTLEVDQIQEIEMPRRCKILSVQSQDNIPVIWVETYGSVELVKKKFLTVGTGEVFHTGTDPIGYIGTYQLHGGSFIGHVYMYNPSTP